VYQLSEFPEPPVAVKVMFPVSLKQTELWLDKAAVGAVGKGFTVTCIGTLFGLIQEEDKASYT